MSCVKVINISLFLIQMCPCLGQVQLITPAGWSSRSGGIHWQIINTLSYDLTVNWLVHTMPATAFRTIHLLSAYHHICCIHDMGSYYIEVMTPRCGYHKCAIRIPQICQWLTRIFGTFRNGWLKTTLGWEPASIVATKSYFYFRTLRLEIMDLKSFRNVPKISVPHPDNKKHSREYFSWPYLEI